MTEKKKGIMGGTFNPVHYGHLLMAETALLQFDLDGVIFIPTGLQWMKKGDPDLLGGDVRLYMTSLATRDNPYFSVSDIEIKREGNTYTCETLEELTKKEPDTKWYYIVGADTLINMPKWRNPGRVFELASILCAVRGDTGRAALADTAKDLEEAYGADISFMDMPRIEISSTDIRNRIKNNGAVRYMLPESVREYINRERLYRK